MKKMTKNYSFLSLLLLLVLVAAIALCAVSCNNDKIYDGTEFKAEEAEKVGKGETEFAFIAQFKDGSCKYYEVKTDKTTVGEALLDEGIIAGEDGAYGLYVKTVAGETLSYEEDGMYWSFYINGEYAMTGVDSTDITEGAVYKFAAAK